MYKKTSRASLFLMELIMSILFFSLAAAVCVQLFVQSHTLSKSSVELNHAVVECESITEYLLGTNGDPLRSENEIFTYYDSEFNKVSEDSQNIVYVLSCEKIYNPATPELINYNISFINKIDNIIIYSISPTYYTKGGLNQ